MNIEGNPRGAGRIEAAKCKNCGHVVKEHYVIKSNGYSCVGNGGKCTCLTFMLG